MSKTVQTDTAYYNAGEAMINTMNVAEARLNVAIGAQTMLNSSPFTIEQRITISEELLSSAISVFPHMRNYVIDAERRIAEIEARFDKRLGELVDNVSAIVHHLTGEKPVNTNVENDLRNDPVDPRNGLTDQYDETTPRTEEPVIDAIRRITKPTPTARPKV